MPKMILLKGAYNLGNKSVKATRFLLIKVKETKIENHRVTNPVA